MSKPLRPYHSSRQSVYLAIAASILTIIFTTAYAILGLKNIVPISIEIFFAAQTLYFVTNAILLYILWSRRDRVSFLLRIFLNSWAGVIVWYTLPMSTLMLLTVKFDVLQFKWLMFAWMWELPGLGAGVVGAYALVFALPIQKLMRAHYQTSNFKKTYRQILRYPIAVAAGMVIIGGISFTTGAVQIGYFADLPVSEQFKMLAFGLATSIFFSIFIYIRYDFLLRDVRHDLELAHPTEVIVGRKYAVRMFVITLLISLGSLVMVGLVVFRSYQYFSSQKIMAESLAHIQNAQHKLASAPLSQYETTLKQVLRQIREDGASSAVIINTPKDISSLNLNAETMEKVQSQKAGIVEDARGTFKIVSFFTEGVSGRKIITINEVSDFYGPITSSMQYFVIGGSFIMLLTASITGFASSNLTRSIRQLSQAVRATQEGKDEFFFDTNTADELEDLAHAFAFYINQSRQLQHTLEQKVEQRTGALMRIEEEKRILEVEAAQKSINAEQEKRQIVEATNKQLEERVEQRTAQLQEAVQRLQELDKLKSEFISIASHQLRTPLTVVRWGYHALLDDKEPPLSATQKQMASAGLKKTLFMIRLVNELLDVARIEENTFNLETKEVAIDRIIQEITDDLKEAAEKKKITINIEHPEKRLPTLLLDSDKIRIAFTNIIDNAIKYSKPESAINVRYALTTTSLAIMISDQGIGIPKDQMYRLFTRFFRGQNASTYHTDGSGLGLYIAKTIIERQGGVISAESEEGKGTTFTVTLPTTRKKSRSLPTEVVPS